nr:hypothetical protein [uncultured Actinomyces sp.]
MVPADDEHKSANEPKDDASTRGTFFGRQKFWKRCKQEEEEPARLTPMPACLMHWWTPLAIAEGLLRWTFLLAVFWGGQPHWPSSEATKLCITIVGAGLAFSAWQQRSHDNIAREKDALAKQEAEKTAQETAERNRRAQIERDEYWKRREQILHTLDSNNPGIRLAAVSLLAELADSAAHSNLLNPTAQQQLQQHIIHTLCLQLRHEGQLVKLEGTEGEHAEIQNAILQVILDRIQDTAPANNCANWSEQTISINNANIITPLTISHTTIQATLDLSNTIFHNTLTIRESSINSILWDSAQFNGELITYSSLIKTESLPKYMQLGRFTETRFLTERERLALTFTPHSTDSSISFYECSFYKCECTCLPNCSCKSYTDHRTCTCIKNKKCTCNNPCMFADVTIQDYDTTYHSAEDIQRLHSLFIHLNSCTMGALILNFHHSQSNADASRNAIHGRLKIIDEEVQPHPIPSTYRTPELLRFNIQYNTIIQAGYQNPVEINIRPKRSIDDFIHFCDNEYQTSNNSNETRLIYYVIDNSNDQPFLFKLAERDTLDDHKIEWRTGGEY